MAPSRQGNGTTGKRKQFSASHAETKRHTRPEEDHSRIESARSIIGAECRENISAPSRGGDFSLDIPFYRTCPVTRRNIKGAPFGVGFECLAQPFQKGTPL